MKLLIFFGSYEESSSFYNRLNINSDFKYIQTFIIPLIASTDKKESDGELKEIQKKDLQVLPVRNPRLLPWEESISKEVLEFESKILESKVKNKKKVNITKLRNILKQFPKSSLINCINKLGYRAMDPIFKLYIIIE